MPNKTTRLTVVAALSLCVWPYFSSAQGGARNLAFGDKDLRTLYMIGNSLYRVRVPIPGSIQY